MGPRNPGGPEHIYLPDSFLLEVETEETKVCLTLEAALEEEHPLFYWPPKSGDATAYALVKWCIQGDVIWNDGPHPPRARDASGEHDYGNIDEWWIEGDVEHVGGEFGEVVIRHPVHTTYYLDN